MRSGEWEAIARLDAYLDGVARGRPVPEDLAPGERDLAETDRRLRALDDAPEPDVTFVARLEGELVGATRMRILGTVTLPPGFTTISNGAAPTGALHLPVPRLRAPRWRWALGHLATAALLVLTIVGSYFVFSASRPGANEEDVIGIPAPTEGVEIEPVLAAIVDVPPPATALDPVHVGVWRSTLPAGLDELEVPGNRGPRLLFVESGRFTVLADAAAQLAPGSASADVPPEQLSPGTAVGLEAGDLLLVATGTGYTLRNSGQAPASVLDLHVFLGSSSAQRKPAYDPQTIGWRMLADASITADSVGSILGGPTAVALARVSLAPGEQLPTQVTTGLELLAVEAGTLGLVRTEGQATYPEITYQAGQAVYYLPPGTGRAIRNAGEGPLVLLVMTVAPASPLTTT